MISLSLKHFKFQFFVSEFFEGCFLLLLQLKFFGQILNGPLLLAVFAHHGDALLHQFVPAALLAHHFDGAGLASVAALLAPGEVHKALDDGPMAGDVQFKKFVLNLAFFGAPGFIIPQSFKFTFHFIFDEALHRVEKLWIHFFD